MSPVWRNPKVGFGAYCIRGTGIRVEFVASRWAAGETIRSLAIDYDLSRDRIEDAIRWHMRKHYRHYQKRSGSR